MTLRVNYIQKPYPSASTLADWDNRWWGTGTGSYSLVTSGGPIGDGPFARRTWATSPANNGDTGFSVEGGNGASGRHPTTPGQTITWSGYMRTNAANKSVNARIYFHNAAGSVISDVGGTPQTLTANTWTRVSYTGTVPALAVTATFILESSAAGGATLWAAGNTLDATNALYEVSGSLGTYFDGNDPFGVWAGTVGASTSTLYVPQITLTQYNDYAPVPRCEVLVVDVPPGTSTLRRSADSRSMDVRGGVDRPSAAGLTLLDTEIPFGVPATYQVECFNNGVSLGFSATAVTTLVNNTICIHQPMDPTQGVAVEMSDDSLRGIKRGFEGEVIYTDGATVGRWIGGRRRGLQGLKMTLETNTAGEADLMQGIFGTYTRDQIPVVCIRTPPGYGRIPRVLFLAVPDISEEDVNIRFGGGLVDFEITGDEVAPPYPGLVASLLGYDDTDAFYATYSALDAAYGTYLARDRDYSKAGYA